MSNPNEKMQLQGFKVITVKFSSTSTAQHEMFMKEHSVRNQTDDKPIGRTLFLINVPPWATTKSLQTAFTQTSRVQSVNFTTINDSSGSGFKTAFVVFKTEPDLYKALKLRQLPPLSTEKFPILTGIAKYMQNYNKIVTSQSCRLEEANAVIRKYDAKEEMRKLNKAGEPDKDGWITVTKKGRNPGVSRKESVKNKLAEKNARKQKVLKNFYRHQIRQEKRDQLALLRKHAEEDKKKILALKQRRAFKPF